MFSCSAASFMNIKRRGESACGSPSFFFNVTNIVSRHRGRAHVADEGKELITWKKAQKCKVTHRIWIQIEYSSHCTIFQSYFPTHNLCKRTFKHPTSINIPSSTLTLGNHHKTKKFKCKSCTHTWPFYVCVVSISGTHSLSHLTRKQGPHEWRRKHTSAKQRTAVN